MHRASFTVLTLLAVAGSVPVAAQLGAPLGLPTLGSVLDTPLSRSGDLLRGTTAQVTEQLRIARLDRIDALVRRERQSIELDSSGEPARRGELVLLDPSAETLAKAEAEGFPQIAREELAGLDMIAVRVAVPQGMSLSRAQNRLVKAVPNVQISADVLHFASGNTLRSAVATSATAPRIATTVGVIDGGVTPTAVIANQQGFARGAPRPSNHGSAVVSLLQRAGVTRVVSADVYGADPAGGSALALARAINWMVGQRVKVISISLVGPPNPITDRAITAAHARGATVLAAVGNDGPAAPPAYPASYPGVLAITAVDGRGRPLIEAGRAAHLDYAAPGADIRALDLRGRNVPVRGTSFAVPLAAARAAAAFDRGVSAGSIIAALDREATMPAKTHRNSGLGRGVLCANCRFGK